MERILCIIPVRNRKPVTVKFLASLSGLDIPVGCELEVTLIDDGSTDGTSAAVADAYPDVRIRSGDGSLFWGGAIQLGLEIFLHGEWGHVWLLNDDMLLHQRCLVELLQAKKRYPERVYSGVVVSPGGELLYGGINCKPGFRFAKVDESAFVNGVAFTDTINGNCALIPRSVLSNMRLPKKGVYIQEGFDMFLGLEASKNGQGPVVTRNAVCYGASNETKFWFYSRSVPLLYRIRGVLGDKGIPPGMYWDFCRRFAGPFAPLYFIRPYLIALIGKRSLPS